MSTKLLRVLIIDDSPADQEIYRRLLLENPGYTYDFLEAESGEMGLSLCLSSQPDCVLLDYLLPDLNGLQFLDALGGEADPPRFPVIMLTGYGNEMIVAEAMRAGAADYLPKDLLSAENLGRAVSNAVEKYQLRTAVENQRCMLEQTNTELVRKNEEIRSFYHMLSHELKTPLTAAREFVSILLDGLAGPLTDTQRDYLGIAKESCDQMTMGLNDLLDVVRLDTGKLHIDPSPFNIGVVVQRAVASLTPMAQEARIDLQHRLPLDLPELSFDARRIMQVLTNLITNALKFTPAGGQVIVEATAEPDGSLLVSVCDTGRGIAPDHCAHIFERLYQARSDDEVFEGGLGLGLYICQEVIKLHRGEIWVESIPGQGSTFYFTLPPDMDHIPATPEESSEEVSA
jgi:signal transduction histidine kinase